MTPTKEDKWFKDLLIQSKQSIQYPGFDDKVMRRIKQLEVAQKDVTRYKLLSWLMLVAGTVFGLLLPYMISWVGTPPVWLDQDQLGFSLSGIMSVGILLVFGILIKSWPMKNPKHTEPF